MANNLVLGSALVGVVSTAVVCYKLVASQAPPRPTKQWADGPFELIKTPRARVGNHDLSKEPGARREATTMALVHNMLIRNLNCIYLQARNIPTSQVQDCQDFMTMVMTWSLTLHLHHGNEEKYFFHWIEDDLQVPHGSVLGGNVTQHHAFAKGHQALDDHVAAVREGREPYDGQKLLDLLDAFVKGPEGLYVHFVEEIGTFEDLEKYDDRIDWKEWAKKVEKEAVANGDWEYELPWAMANMDVDHEDGIHLPVWPPFPWFIGLLLRYWHYPKHAGAWRFCCCDASGHPRDLPYV